MVIKAFKVVARKFSQLRSLLWKAETPGLMFYLARDAKYFTVISLDVSGVLCHLARPLIAFIYGGVESLSTLAAAFEYVSLMICSRSFWSWSLSYSK